MQAKEEVLEYFESRKPQMIAAIERIVSIESPSSDVSALSSCAAKVADYFEEMTGVQPIWHHDDMSRPHLQLDLGDQPDVLLIGHFDTVHPIGTLERNPVRIEGDRLCGPGALDMKGGIVMIAEVARYLQQTNPRPNVTIFLNSDEELGSGQSGHILRKIATGGRAALVFESTLHSGVLKVGARGVREIRITAKGKGGHAAYPEHYINPVDAIGDVLVAARKFHDPNKGAVVSATMLDGSTAYNAVADTASVHFSVRATSDAKLDEIFKGLTRIKAADQRVEIEVEELASIPTFKLDANNYAFELAKRASATLGFDEPRGIEARGASDANQIASVVPHAIEGLGGWGDGLHNTRHEFLHISSLVPSVALASLMSVHALEDADVHAG